MNKFVLTINGGSSSIKFGIFDWNSVTSSSGKLLPLVGGQLERIGAGAARLIVKNDSAAAADAQRATIELGAVDRKSAGDQLLKFLEARAEFASVRAVAHRVVHGLDRTDTQAVTPELVKALHDAVPYAPEVQICPSISHCSQSSNHTFARARAQHLPLEVAVMETIAKRHPTLTQVACFDTSFHTTLPRVAYLLPLPRRYEALGIRRYGFHGLSCVCVERALLSSSLPITKRKHFDTQVRIRARRAGARHWRRQRARHWSRCARPRRRRRLSLAHVDDGQ